MQALAGQFEILDVPQDTVLFNEGEPGDSLYIVVAGKVKLGRRAVDGRESPVAVMGPSDEFGELPLFDPGPRARPLRPQAPTPAWPVCPSPRCNGGCAPARRSRCGCRGCWPVGCGARTPCLPT